MMKEAALALASVISFLSVAAPRASAPAAPAPENLPTCASPQAIAPMQAAGGNQVYLSSEVVWNGKDFAVAWVDYADARLHFRRFFADGTPAAAGVVPSALVCDGHSPSLVWNGSGYGVAWRALSPSGYEQIYFARLSANGALVGSEVKASFVGSTETADCFYPSLAWSGSVYALAWGDSRGDYSGYRDIFATLLNGDGTIANGGASHDLIVCDALYHQEAPSLAWSSAYGRFVAVWQDSRNSTYDIYGATLSPLGAVSGSSLLDGGAGLCFYPSVADMGNGLGLTWGDTRDGNNEIYFARLSATGGKVGADLRLTNDSNASYAPRIVWTGAEFGVFWYESRSGNYETWFQRVSAAGAVLGSNVQVTVSTNSEYPAAAFAKYGYLATSTLPGLANFVQAWGCNYAYQPPCPENLVAYGITGTAATVSWLPAIDNSTDIAYYQVYRNNALVGQTSDTYFADSGLSLNTTYQYAIRTVNAAQYTSTGCGSGSSLYVKTNATLMLMVNKSTPDAALTWTDATMNNYNIYRGTSPQVMSQIGSTAGQSFDDPNVLTDNVLYFYTVDEPGW